MDKLFCWHFKTINVMWHQGEGIHHFGCKFITQYMLQNYLLCSTSVPHGKEMHKCRNKGKLKFNTFQVVLMGWISESFPVGSKRIPNYPIQCLTCFSMDVLWFSVILIPCITPVTHVYTWIFTSASTPAKPLIDFLALSKYLLRGGVGFREGGRCISMAFINLL